MYIHSIVQAGACAAILEKFTLEIAVFGQFAKNLPLESFSLYSSAIRL